ncbi:hypothetical protein K469DRAFT_706091 [Zopfia rhizophila CBS 207.26]|uniref:Uncharacterized protein n=1 Tax=Zopfia rhizophila CBS 207.26 TaxID=1314779 RepID=A0A6A6EV15_9PEZI|nr:hypothetical protein K469DRAFT_706091 [Zopfia rhizophila CBS 207.26]
MSTPTPSTSKNHSICPHHRLLRKMAALFSTVKYILNLLLPFTNPQTPLLQDFVHTAVLCSALYFAPQIAEHYHNRSLNYRDPTYVPSVEPDGEAEVSEQDEIPHDVGVVEEPDEADQEDVALPPLAPTPPELQQQHQAFVEDDEPIGGLAEPIAGPANPQPNGPRPTPQNRVIGAKKAKSLARKDQRRAYHEFHRQQAEIRRAQEAEGKEKREALLAEEKKRRAEVEREIQAREKEGRERKKEEERREVEQERQRRERVVRLVKEGLNKQGAVDLVELTSNEGKDQLWIERLVKASGILSQSDVKGEAHIMITGDGWVVRIDAELMREAYASAMASGERKGGKITFEEFGGFLENAVKRRAKS